MTKKTYEIKLNVDTTEVDEALNKASELYETLLKANSLVDELAKKDININLTTSIDKKAEKIKGISIDLTSHDIQPKEVKNESQKN